MNFRKQSFRGFKSVSIKFITRIIKARCCRRKIRDSFDTLRFQIDKLKKDTSKEMENNERLTSVQTRLEDDIDHTQGAIVKEKEKLGNLENEIIKVSSHSEQTQNEFDTACYVSAF